MTDTTAFETVRTIPEAVTAAATTYGDRLFYHDAKTTLSYAEVDHRSTQIANSLQAQGVSPGDHVCLYLYNSAEYLLLLLAIAKAGGVAVPVDTRFTDQTLTDVLSRVDGDTIFIDAATRPEYENVRAQQTNLTTEYFVGETTAEQYLPYDDLATGSAKPLSVTRSESDTAAVLFVQHDTADPSAGVMLPQYAFVAAGIEAGDQLFEFDTTDTVLTSLPLYSIFTLQTGVMGALVSGSEFVLLDQFKPQQFWQQVQEYDASVFLYLSRMLPVLYNQDIAAEYANNPVRLAIGHGYSFGHDRELIRDFEQRYEITVLEGYGTTQTGISLWNDIHDRRIGSVGTPVSYATVDIVDEADRPVATNDPGEIVVRPAQANTMMTGYYDDPEATVAACQNQWIHTGDRGYRDADGYVFTVANKQNSIYRGQVVGRISTLEIESIIDSHPAVQTSIVTGVTTQTDGEEILAVVVPEQGQALTPVDICQHCERELPRIKVPRYIDIRDSLPRTPTGKLRKDDLTEISVQNVWDRHQGYEFMR